MRVVLCGRSCRVLRAVYPDKVIRAAFQSKKHRWFRQNFAKGLRVVGRPTKERAIAIAMLMIYASHAHRFTTRQARRDRYKLREEAERILQNAGV